MHRARQGQCPPARPGGTGAPGRTSRRCPRITIWPLRSCTSDGTLAKPLGTGSAAIRPTPGVEAPTPGCFARWRPSPGPATGLSPAPTDGPGAALAEAARPDPVGGRSLGHPPRRGRHAPQPRGVTHAPPLDPGRRLPGVANTRHPHRGGGRGHGRASGRSTLGDSATRRPAPLPAPTRGTPVAPVPPRGLLDLTVARPGIRRGQPPLEELSDRVARLRHLAWTLSEVGSAPATVHGNLAAIGIVPQPRRGHRAPVAGRTGTR